MSELSSAKDRIDRLLFSLSSLSDIGEILTSSGNFSVKLKSMLRLVLGVLTISRGALLLYDPQQDLLTVQAVSGLRGKKPVAFPMRSGWGGALADESEPIPVSALKEKLEGWTPAHDESLHNLQAYLWMPLVVQQRLVGVLSVSERYHQAPYEAEDLTLLATVARNMAVGIYNHTLIEESKNANVALNRKVLELETLYDVGMAMTSELNIDTLTEEVLLRLVAVLALRAGFIVLNDDQGSALTVVGSFGLEPDAVDKLCNDEIPDKIHTVLQQGTPQILNDLHAGGEQTPGRHLMLVPLKARDDTIGVIGVMDKESRKTDVQPFTDQDIHLVTAFANQAAVAIANARLYRDILEMKNYNANILASISSGVVTTDLDGMIVSVNRAAMRILNADEETFLHNHWQVLTDYLNHDDMPALIDQVQKSGEGRYLSQIVSTVGDTQLVLDVGISPLADEQQAIRGLVITLDDLSEENRIRNIFKRYVSDRVVDMVLHPDQQPTLGGEIREIVVVFTDLRGFTRMQEETEPEEMVATLNEYFHEMVEVIAQHNGTLSRIEGDGLMVLYGAPITFDDEIGRAIETVLDMQKALDRLNERRTAAGDEALAMGIGMASGQVLAGNIGSHQRMEYTVIGDPVNLAARLVDIALGGQILISEGLFREIKDRFRVEHFRTIRVKGKKRPVNIYELRSEDAPAVGEIDVQQEESAMKKPSSEVDLTIPMLPEMELAASKTATAVAEFMGLDQNKVEEIRLALIEACINAIEHSRSKDRKVHINFAIREDHLEIVIQDFGEGFDVEDVRERIAERDSNKLLKRGWGLKIMEELMDEVEMHSGRKGTSIRMIKRK